MPSPRKREGASDVAGEGTRPPSENDETPGVPGFRSWRGVYVFVFTAFVVVVVLLAIFSRVYA